jgi:gamma-glutamyl-gamma-aminobutyrate hydrolase PuuD
LPTLAVARGFESNHFAPGKVPATSATAEQADGNHDKKESFAESHEVKIAPRQKLSRNLSNKPRKHARNGHSIAIDAPAIY